MLASVGWTELMTSGSAVKMIDFMNVEITKIALELYSETQSKGPVCVAHETKNCDLLKERRNLTEQIVNLC